MREPARALFTKAVAARPVTRESAFDWIMCGPAGLAPWQIRRAQDYIETHYARDLSLEDIARQVRLSPFHFARAFRRETGVPPHQYLIEVRLKRASALLETTRLSIAEVAAAVGYEDQSYFARIFHRAFGVTPSAYRRGAFL